MPADPVVNDQAPTPAGPATRPPWDVPFWLRSAGLRPSRALGQHFLADANTARRIVRLAALTPGERVLEIGPGLGALTRALVEAGAQVRALEADRHLLPVLAQTVAPLGVEVVLGDACQVDWTTLAPPPGPWAVVANLPYNVAVPIVMGLLETAPQVTRLVVMVQREVADRLVAGPGSKAYGAVSVLVAYRARARRLGAVPATVFVPRPKVASALVALERREQPALDLPGPLEARLVTLVRAGFGHRRKTLRQALAGLVPEDGFLAAGVDPRARAETLDLEAWGRLARWSPVPAGLAPEGVP
ncbi:16S rRNA (adenine(1518)-N(6)/adenine(1519)-N(6))-dimethyltransferase RsmA [Aciditerrimonas ferrireducens]|uniref:Ribosomal RNA small subunit methyltransferase A n=1 Tax=Aciditerrimonas ferrireducens TaxID=667306 RepID=A0ABV6C1E6_9ACTN